MFITETKTKYINNTSLCTLCTHTRTHIPTHTNTYTHAQIRADTHTRTHPDTCLHTYIHTYIHNTYIRARTHTHTHNVQRKKNEAITKNKLQYINSCIAENL